MFTSHKGIAFIERHEGKNYKSYQDGGGVWTIGSGHTHGVYVGMECTELERVAWLSWDISNAEATIARFTTESTRLQLSQSQYDTLVDFTFNVGVIGWLNKDGTLTGLCRAITDHRWQDVPKELKRWVYDRGVIIHGLAARRADECALWET